MRSIIKNNKITICLFSFLIIIAGYIFLFVDFDSIVFDRPIDGVIDDLNDKMYVLNAGGFVTVIDLKSNSPIKKFKVSYNPAKIKLNINIQKLYISSKADNTITIIDLKNERMKIVPVGLKPQVIYVNTVNNKAYILNYNSQSVSVIDGFSDKVIATIPVGGKPSSIDILKSLNIVYVVSSLDKKLTIIDGEKNEVNSIVQLDFNPVLFFVAQSGQYLYLGDGTNKAIVLADVITGEIKEQFDSVGRPASVFLSKKERTIYLANNLEDKNNFIIIDIKSKTEQLFNIEGIISKIRRFDDKMYLLNSIFPKLSVIDQETYGLIKDIDLESFHQNIILNKATGKIYLFAYSNRISVINTETNQIEVVISNTTDFISSKKEKTVKGLYFFSLIIVLTLLVYFLLRSRSKNI